MPATLLPPAAATTQFLPLDDGRLLIDPQFHDLLADHGLTTFDAWFGRTDGETVREVKRRRTTRLILESERGARTFYLKRHRPLSTWEFVRSALKLNWPIHGARPELEAILAFQHSGIPTVTPVAFGEHEGNSLLVTESLDGYLSLRDLLEFRNPTPAQLKLLIREVAELTRRMHEAGMAHQDFYFDHLMLPAAWPDDADSDLHVIDLHLIDLGRVRPATLRWKVKDLAQLNYSARSFSAAERWSFLEQYLGRKVQWTDWGWLTVLLVKSWWIAHHTRRRAL